MLAILGNSHYLGLENFVVKQLHYMKFTIKIMKIMKGSPVHVIIPNHFI